MEQTDWTVLGPLIVAALGAIGGAIAWLSGAFTKRGADQHDRQKARDDAATKDADRTLAAVWTLLDQLQEEVKRRGDALNASEQRCSELIQLLEQKVTALKDEVSALNRKVGDLERELLAR